MANATTGAVTARRRLSVAIVLRGRAVPAPKNAMLRSSAQWRGEIHLRHHAALELRRALQYVPELTWLLFLRILDEQEAREVDEAEALGIRFKSSVPNRIAGAIGPRRIRRCARTKTPASGNLSTRICCRN